MLDVFCIFCLKIHLWHWCRAYLLGTVLQHVSQVGSGKLVGLYIRNPAREALACVVGACQMLVHQVESSLEVCGLPFAKNGPATSI